MRIRTYSKLIVLTMTLMIVLSSVQGTVCAQAGELDPLVVMYDASHNPQFSVDDEGFQLMLDMVNESTRYIVRVNEEPLNTTILNGVDVLIIADPDDTAAFENEEILAIDQMMTNGSSLLLFGNPVIDQNNTEYWNQITFRDIGDNKEVNGILDQLNITGVRFSLINRTQNIWSDSMFDYDRSLNATSMPYVLQLDPSTWDASHPIFKDINSLVTMTASLKPSNGASVIARSYDTTFAQYRAGPNSFANLTYPNMTLAEFAENPDSYSSINGTLPAWMSAFEYDGSRVIISGSAIMFTGKTLPYDDAEEQWFYQADNSRLFMNMLSWLTDGFVDSPDAIVPMALLSSVILVVGVAIYLFKKTK
ncbi:MAG: hypothetical protein ACFFED_08095 [Candidatus Thorarchaeota archaeon]